MRTLPAHKSQTASWLPSHLLFLWLHAGHYTGHFKAVITKPQNVLVMRDVACAGYVAGCNTQWFAKDYPGTEYSLSKAQTNVMKRLSFADDLGAKYSSMLAFPCWAGQFESGHLDTVMSVTTRLLPWEVTTATGGTHYSFPGGQAAYTAYSNKLNLRSIHFGEDMKAAENQDFISQARGCTFEHVLRLLPSHFELSNTMGATDYGTWADLTRCVPVVRRARQTTPRASWARRAASTPSPSPSCRSSRARATSGPTPSRGCVAHVPSPASHPCAQPPRVPAAQDARWRRGESVSLKTARDSMVGLELAQHAQMVFSKA